MGCPEYWLSWVQVVMLPYKITHIQIHSLTFSTEVGHLFKLIRDLQRLSHLTGLAEPKKKIHTFMHRLLVISQSMP